MTPGTRILLGQVIRHLCLAGGGVVVLWPFVTMLLTAFTPEERIFSGMSLTDLTLDNFRIAWQQVPWIHYLANSVVVTGLIFLGQVIVCLPAGYALARLRLPGGKAMFWVIIACLAVPTQAIAVPLYIGFAKVGALDTVTALILPFIGSAFAIFIFRQFILTIPSSLFDAARMDGVRQVALLWRVVLPNVKPALAAFAVFSVVGHWNDLFWPTVMLRTDRSATVPFAIGNFVSAETGASYGPQMAAATIAMAPLFVAFLFVQKRLVEGISLSGSQE